MCKRNMLQRYCSWIIAIAMVLSMTTSFMSVVRAEENPPLLKSEIQPEERGNETSLKSQAIEKLEAQIAREDAERTEPKRENPKVLDLMKQAQTRYADSDRVGLMLIPKTGEDTFASMSNPEELATKADQMSPEKAAEERQQVLNEQNAMLNSLQTEGFRFTESGNRLTILLNAVPVETDYATAKKIAAHDSVKRVLLSRTYDRIGPEMTHSVNMIHAPNVWNNHKFKGEGTVVAIIDSGIDPKHEVLSKLADPSKAKLKPEDAQRAVKTFGMPEDEYHQYYYSEKVPFGMAISQPSVVDPNPHSHGMHVAGTVAGYFDDKDRHFSGVAPEAQVLGFNVFNMLGGTSSDNYIFAMEVAYFLRADAVNMSLGRSVGTEDEIDPAVLDAIGKLEKLGTVVSISAGNDGTVGYQSGNVRADNPDFGVIADPSLVEPSLSVASLENLQITSKPILVKYPDKTDATAIAYKDSDNSANFSHPESIPVIYCGLGHPEDFEGKDISGKAVLVDRGVIAFEEKAQNAMKAVRDGQEKPVVLIVSNNISDAANSMTMGAVKLPAVAIGQSDGSAIKDALSKNQQVTVAFPGTEQTFDNPMGGMMSDFSSWGPTPNLGFKPEITAPGGRIVSSVNTDDAGVSHYEEMSGTSMSSPHVTGAVALLKQKLMQERNLKNPAGAEAEKPEHQALMTALKHDLKNILMSTAKPNERNGVMVSPRQQGAGMLDIQAAVESHAYLYDAKPRYQKDGAPRECKINLREINNSIECTVGVHNFGTKPLHYKVRYTAQTDHVDENGVISMTPEALLSGTLPEVVEVPAGNDVLIPISFALEDAEIQAKLKKMPNGAYVDGFIVLDPVDPEQDGPSLSIPYLGFNGDWTRLPMTEPSVYDLKKTGVQPLYARYSDESTFAFTHLYTRNYDNDGVLMMHVLGAQDGLDPTNIDYNLIDGNKLAISPNGDSCGDQAFFSATMYRNYKINLQVLNEAGKTIWTPNLGPRTEGKKNFKYDNLVTHASFWYWAGDQGSEDSPQPVEEGKYTFRVQLTPRLESKYFGGKEIKPEIQDYTVYVDNTKPEIKSVEEKGNQVILHAEDKGVGVMNYLFEYNNKILVSRDGTLSLPDDWVGHVDEIRVTAKDWAQNQVSELIKNLQDQSKAIGSIKVNITFDDLIRPRRVDLVAEDEQGNKYYDLDHLPLGKYRVFNINLPYGLQLNPQEQVVELTRDKPKAEVSFEVKEEDMSMGYVFIHLKKPGAYTQAVRPYIVEKSNGKRTLVGKSSGDKYSNIEHFSTRASFGEYHLYFDNVKEGYEIYPNNFDISVQPEKDAEMNFIITKAGEIGSIHTKIETDPEVQLTDEQKNKIKFHAVHQEEQIEIPDLEKALFGTYRITVSDLPEDVFADPGIQEIHVDAEHKDVTVTVRLRSSKGIKAGSIVIENNPADLSKRPPEHEGRGEFGDADNPEFKPTDQPVFYIEDANGKKYEEGKLTELPYGYYKIHIARYPSGYALKGNITNAAEETLYTEEIREVVLTPEKPVAKEIYEWESLYPYNQSGSVYIRPIFNRSKMAPMFNFRITNSKGRVQTMKYAKDGFFTDSLILPYDTYTIEPINLKQGISAKPKKIEIPVCTGYQIVRFYYDSDDTVEPLPEFKEGPGRVQMEMPIAQQYAFNPTLSIYTRKDDGSVSEKPAAKSECHMELFSMSAGIKNIPEGKYELRVEDIGEGYVALPNHIPFEIHDNRVEREHYYPSIRIYPIYQQPVQTEGLPDGISVDYEAEVRTGDHRDPLGKTTAQEGQFQSVPIGKEYFIRPTHVPEGYAVEPQEQRVNYIDSFDGHACAKPQVIFRYYKLENGVNLQPLQEAMDLAGQAIAAEEGSISTRSTDESITHNADIPASDPAPSSSDPKADESGKQTEPFFVMDQATQDQFQQDPGKVFFHTDLLTHSETLGELKRDQVPGYFKGYDEFKKSYLEIQDKMKNHAYTNQDEVRKDRELIRNLVSHLQRKDLCKQWKQVNQSAYAAANQSLTPGSSSVTLFVGTEAIREDKNVHWNMKLVDFSGHEFFPERDQTTRSNRYTFQGLPKGEYSCQLYNDAGYTMPIREHTFYLTGEENSFEKIDCYLARPVKWPVQRLLYDPKTDQVTSMDFEEGTVDIHYNSNTVDTQLGKMVKGYEGKYEELGKLIEKDPVIRHLDPDFQDGTTWIDKVKPESDCRVDFIEYLPLNDGFWVRPIHTPEGYRAVDFERFDGIESLVNLRCLRLYYVKDNSTNPNPKPDPDPNPNPKPDPDPNPNPNPNPDPNPNPNPNPDPNPNPAPNPNPKPNPDPGADIGRKPDYWGNINPFQPHPTKPDESLEPHDPNSNSNKGERLQSGKLVSEGKSIPATGEQSPDGAFLCGVILLLLGAALLKLQQTMRKLK